VAVAAQREIFTGVLAAQCEGPQVVELEAASFVGQKTARWIVAGTCLPRRRVCSSLVTRPAVPSKVRVRSHPERAR
jgi:hypothetical protein